MGLAIEHISTITAATHQRPPGMFRKGFEVLLYVCRALTLLAGKVCHDTAVLSTTGLGLVAGYRLGLAIAFSDYAAGFNIEGGADVIPDTVGTPLGKFLVIGVAGSTVRMTGNLALGIGEVAEEVANGFQFVMVLGLDVRLVGIEVDRQHGRFAAEALGGCGSLGCYRCRGRW